MHVTQGNVKDQTSSRQLRLKYIPNRIIRERVEEEMHKINLGSKINRETATNC
jgi:hypothetical protein